MNYYKDTHKGNYKLVHPEKYMSNIPLPVFKSEWEQKIFVLMDINPFIIKWGYEPFSIVYASPHYLKTALYKPDIYCECKYSDGNINKYLIEIKPTKYMILPKEPKLSKSTTDANKLEKFRKKKINFDMTTMDVMVNAAKWNAAEVWCKNRGVNWLILNEKNVGNLFKQ